MVFWRLRHICRDLPGSRHSFEVGDIPVRLRLFENVQNDQTTRIFLKSLEDEIQGSGKFYLSLSSDLPPNGIRVTIRSVQVKLAGGEELGSAIFIEADRPIDKESGQYTSARSNRFAEMSEQMWMLPKDGSATDQIRGFLSDLDKAR